MTINIHAHRNGSPGRDKAILDLLHLQELGLAPGSVTVEQLRELWGLSQPQVSRRMAAIHQLGIYWIRSDWGRYRIHTGHERRAQRFEAIRQRIKQATNC
jgi:DNA-binding IclR family transcriptional regulator